MFKDPSAGLGQFLTFESPIKKDENAFYVLLKALFVLEIFTFLCCLFGYVKKRLDKKAMINFKIYDNFKYLKKKRQSDNKREEYFLQKSS